MSNKSNAPLDAYIAPQCEMSELETRCALLEGSPKGNIPDFGYEELF